MSVVSVFMLAMGLAHYRDWQGMSTRRPSALCRYGILFHTGENLNAEVFSPGPSVFIWVTALPVVAVVFDAANQLTVGGGPWRLDGVSRHGR